MSWLYYANRLYELPLGVSAVAIAVVIVPRITASVHARDKAALAAAQSRAYEIAAALALPAAAGFALLAKQITSGLFEHGEFVEFRHPRVPGRHTHGTGCTFAAAITSHLALGRTLREAIPRAQRYIADAIRHAPDLGKGHGPMQHFVQVEK